MTMSTSHSACQRPQPSSSVAVLVGFSYLLGLFLLLVAWFGSHPDLSMGVLGQLGVPGQPLSDLNVFALCLAGVGVLAFARRYVPQAGSSPVLFFPILTCALLGFGVWALALFEPSSVFTSPLTGGMKFAAFVIGWFALAAVSYCSRALAGKISAEDDQDD